VTPQQLRTYRIQAGHLDDFVAAWTAGVLPLRKRFGFRSAAWTVPGEDVFIWLLTHVGPGSFEDADAAYYASLDRAALAPDPAQSIANDETSWLTPVSAGRSSGGDSAP
jgi:hypothetical protein